jgi:uncharacterized repeat protein (TIGR01451 family)
MATFYNQATLRINGKTVTSNQTEGEVVTRVTLAKTAVSSDYAPNGNIIYAVTLVNNDDNAKNNITLTDNLGRFTPPVGPEVIPLSYVGGTVLYYQNGVLQPTPNVNAGTSLVISGIDIPAGGNVIILYEVQANEFAPSGANAVINNLVEAVGSGLCDELYANAEIPTRDEPNLSIAKAICPDEVSCGDQVTYTFIIQNVGNTNVVATDNLIVSDLFNPVLNDITVELDGIVLAEGTGYTYNDMTGEFTTIGGAIPVPAATFTRDPETGVVSTTPGVAILTVTGAI